MGQFRTRAGVVIEMNDAAARAVGYEPVETEKKPRATRGRSKKADEKPAEEDD